MSMPIQRQSESFGIFDDGPRFARDRSSTELPRGLAGILNTGGPRIQAGLLNTRTAGEKIMPWSAGDWEGAEQFSGDYAEDAYRNHPDSWSHQPTEQDYADWEARHPHLAINFGKGPRDHGGAGPDGGPALPDWYYDGDSEDDDDEYAPDSDPERFVPENFMDYPDRTARRGSGRLPFDRTAADAAVADPAAMAPQLPVGGGFQAGHRVGLDWRDSTVPGTVIANDGQVHVRWDDGQYTSEDPTEVHLL